MQSMRSIWQKPTLWPLPLQLPGVLHPVGIKYPTQQSSSSRDAGGYCEVSRQPWPGANIGIRCPDIDETPLSDDECWVAVRECMT